MEDDAKREALQTLYGLYEMLDDSLSGRNKRDFQRFVSVEEELVLVRIARLEEKLNTLRILVSALGTALVAVAGTIAILAD